MCGTISDINGTVNATIGPILRGGVDLTSGYAIVVGWFHNGSSEGSDLYVSLQNNGAWSCDVDTNPLNSSAAPYTICAQVSGTGAWANGASGTKIRVWLDPASANCTGTPDVDYADWAGGTSCLTSGVASSTDTQEYVGWVVQQYGVTSYLTLDDFFADDM